MKNLSNIDFKKYKRFFVFGCSFTAYKWPTWADILSTEMPDAEFYNFGRPGAGNLFISNQVVESNQRYKFDNNDLVIVLWSTMCREDRYINNWWSTPGNIYTQNIYNKEFVSKYSDTKGYLIRDMALIALTTTYLKYSDADAITLTSVPYDYQQDPADNSVNEVLSLYKDIINETPQSMLESVLNNEWVCGHYYYSSNHPKDKFGDYHPGPQKYYNFLKKLGFPLTCRSHEYSEISESQLKLTNTADEVTEMFASLRKSQENKIL